MAMNRRLFLKSAVLGLGVGAALRVGARESAEKPDKKALTDEILRCGEILDSQPLPDSYVPEMLNQELWSKELLMQWYNSAIRTALKSGSL